MLVTAVVTRVELVSLIESLTPLRVAIDERRGRSVTLGRPEVKLVPGHGLRLRGDARVTWDVAGVAIPVTLQAWQILFVPRVVAGPSGRMLAFQPIVEELDLKLVPSFLNGKIARAIRDGIGQNRDKLAWDFARILSRRFPLPLRMAPASAFEIAAVDAAVTVTDTELRLEMRFEAKIEAKIEKRSGATPAAAPPALARERESERAIRAGRVDASRVVSR